MVRKIRVNFQPAAGSGIENLDAAPNRSQKTPPGSKPGLDRKGVFRTPQDLPAGGLSPSLEILFQGLSRDQDEGRERMLLLYDRRLSILPRFLGLLWNGAVIRQGIPTEIRMGRGAGNHDKNECGHYRGDF